MVKSYELGGRAKQKARTRAAIVGAARELLREGVIPNVADAADRASVSRTTAYRYFPNQAALVAATYPELEHNSLLDPARAPEGPDERLEQAMREFFRQLLAYEPELRAQLRLSLQHGAGSPDAKGLPFRQGRAIAWISEALTSLESQLGPTEFRRLVLAIRASIGVEALVWLVDIAGVSRREAVDIMRTSARRILAGALADTDT